MTDFFLFWCLFVFHFDIINRWRTHGATPYVFGNLMSSISDKGSIDSDKDRDGYIDGLTRIGKEDTDKDGNHIHTCLFMSVGSSIVLDHSHDSQTPIPFLFGEMKKK